MKTGTSGKSMVLTLAQSTPETLALILSSLEPSHLGKCTIIVMEIAVPLRQNPVPRYLSTLPLSDLQIHLEPQSPLLLASALPLALTAW